MMLITHYLKKIEEECEKQAKEKGHEFRKREIHTAIESAKPILPVSYTHLKQVI